jgi:phage-related protein (TIGR01555 family)
MTQPISAPTSPGVIGRRYAATDAIVGRHGLSRNTGKAQDFFSNAAARTGFGTPSLTEGTSYELVRMSNDYWLLVTLYRNHWISRRIVDTPASDMVRAWPRLTSEIDPDDISRIDKVIRKTQTKSKVLLALQWARLFGGAGALIQIDGHENILDEPLDIDSVELGAFKGLIPFDRWSGIYPSVEVGKDISRPLEYNLPEFYTVQNSVSGGSFKVHASRIMRFIGPSVPQPEYQAQQYWGISSLEPAYEEIRKRDNMSWNILSLTYRANLISMVNPELAQMLSGLGMSQQALVNFTARMQQMNQMLSNQNMLIVGKDGDVKSSSYGFSGLDSIYEQFQLDIAGAAEIPATRLFGRIRAGLGSENDADERVYEEFIALKQDTGMRPQLEGQLYPVVCMSALGEVPDDLDLLFPSIRVLDGKDKSELAKAISETIVSLYSSGIIKKPQALMEIKQSSDITEIGTNITTEDIEEAEKEEKLLPALPPGEDEPKETTKTGDSAAFRNVEFVGFPITIEVEAGERRTLRNDAGDVVYDRLLQNAYGFLQFTIGRDGDEVDVILGEDESARNVWIADMQDLGPDVDKRSDEDKVLVGFSTKAEAIAAFSAMYPKDWMRSIRGVPVDKYREALVESVTA